MNDNLAEKKKKTKAKFTPEEDSLLISLVQKYGDSGWGAISQHMGNKTSRQCRERWQNYLNPTLSATEWTCDDDKLLIEKQKELGPRWNTIARFFGDRSGNNVRNRWLMITRKEKKKMKFIQRNAKIDPNLIPPTFGNVMILDNQIVPMINHHNEAPIHKDHYEPSNALEPKTNNQIPEASNIFDIFCSASLIDFDEDLSMGYF